MAGLTLLAANQVFPFLSQLVEIGGQHRVPEIMDVKDFCSDPSGLESATALKSLFDAHGSDKSRGHNYHLIYGTLLREAGSISRILEVGLGTNNADVVSTMGRGGQPGASLRAFRDYCPNAEVVGADVDDRILFQEERINTFWVDQTRLESFRDLGASVSSDFDVIIDDGLHAPNANIAVLLFSIDRLKSGGWVVIEDIRWEALPVWQVIAALMPSSWETHLLRTERALVFAARKPGGNRLCGSDG